MLKEERQQLILDRLYEYGNVTVNKLSDEFSVSKDSIRRDLTELEEQGILKRVFGGAVPFKMLTADIDKRMNVEKDRKYMVGRKAVALLKPDSLVAIDGGTTNLRFVSIIPLSIKLRVVTNSFPVAEELRKRQRVDVIFLGGRINKESQTTVGETVLKQLADYHFDQCFIGAYAVDAENGITVPYPYDDEAAIKRYLVENSDDVNIMCSLSKLDKVSNYNICKIDSVSRIICEYPVQKEIQNRYKGKRY